MTDPNSHPDLGELKDEGINILPQGRGNSAKEKGRRDRIGFLSHRQSRIVLQPLCGSKRMMAFSYIILPLVVMLVSTGFTYSSELSDELQPLVKTLRRECWSSANCGTNEYCYGKGETKRCIACFDCATVRRKPRMRTYDGEDCAKHQWECGECETKFKEAGGVCMPEDRIATTPTTTSTRFINGEGGTDYHRQIEDEIQDASTTPIIVIVLSSLLSILVLGLAIYVIHHLTRRLWKQGNGQDEETAGLYNRSYESPTAPLSDEYSPPPPLYAPAQSNQLSGPRNSIAFDRPIVPRRHQAETANALPFAKGNGSSTWIVTNENAPVEQTGDGNGDHELCRRTSDSSTADDTVDAPTTGNHANSGIPPSEDSRPLTGQVAPQVPPSTGQNSRSQQNLSGGVVTSTPRHSLPGNASQIHDPVIGTFSLRFSLQGVFGSTGANFSQIFSSPPPNPAPARMTISAPTSPRRAVDDTHIENMMDLSENFLPSNLSLDSGRGSAEEHDRSVPSRSVSGGDVRGGSDMDDSMFGDNGDDDEEEGRLLGTHDGPPEVPDFDGEAMELVVYPHFDDIEE